VVAFLLQHKNKQLVERNSLLLLQNDSVLSVNLKLQKDMLHLQRGIDSMVHTPIDKQRLTRR